MLDIPKKVKELFKTDGILKNIRISFPNGERADICNDQIIKESLKFDESISSREEIKFGLCESSQLSFECVDVGNIRGMEIEAAIEIDCSTAVIVYYPTQAYQPVIVKVVDEGEEYYVVVTNIAEHDEPIYYIYTNDGTDMYGGFYTGEYGLYFLFETDNNNAGTLDIDYYRSVTGHDPRGTEADTYDGYPGGGYARTYVYSTASEKFYSCETYWDWEGISYSESLGYDVPYNTMPLSYILSTGFQSDNWFKLIGEILFDNTEHAYYSGIETQTASDVPFPFYRIPLGRFIVDEAKRDAGMSRRRVVAYSQISELPSTDWWTSLHTVFYSNKPLNFNIMNFIIATNNKMFDSSEFTKSAISGWVKLNTISPFTDSSIRFLEDASFAFESTNGKKYFITLSIDEGDAYYKELYSDQYLSVPNTDKLGILEKYDLSHNYERSRENSIDTITNAIPDAPDLVERVLSMIDFIGLPNPIMSYRTIYWGNAGISYAGRTLSVGDMFLLPPKLVLVGTASARIYEVTSSGNVYKCAVGMAYLDDIADVTISEVATGFDDWTIPIKADYIEETPDATDATFEKKILYLDMRKLLESYVELHGCFGRIKRGGYFGLLQLAEITIDSLFPNHDIIPNSALYPMPYTSITADTADLAIIGEECTISLWYEEYFIKYGALICEYTSSEVLDEDNNPAQVVREIRWDSGKNVLTYDVSDNEYIKNNIWTAAQIEALLAPLVEALNELKFYPSDLSCVGLPYIEAGDWVLASYHGNNVLGLVLSRTLSGIQALRDKMKSD